MTLEDLAARVARLEAHVFGEPEQPPTLVSYTVVRGDTLGGIAARHGVTVDQLAAWNGITNPNLISVGQVLRLTAPAPEPDPEPTPDPEPDPEPAPEPSPELAAPTGLRVVATADGRVSLDWNRVAGEGVTYPIAEHLYQGRRVEVDRVVEPRSVRGPLAPAEYGYSVAVRTADGRQSPDSTIVRAVVVGAPDEAPAPSPAPDPTPPPAPPSGPVKVGSRLVFDGRMPGGFARATNLQCLGYNGSPSGYRGDRARVGEFYGRQACRFLCGPDDVQAFRSKPRSELRQPGVMNPAVGQERWYQLGFLLEEGSTVSSDWFIITQWHAGSGSPTMALQIDRDGWLVLSNNRDWSHNRRAFKVVPGQWHDLVLHTRFGASTDTGWAEMWEGGRLVLPRHGRVNILAGGEPYMKFGIYQGGGANAGVCHAGIVATAP